MWEQFCLWTSLPNFPITTLVKFLSSFIKRTAKTSICISGLWLILEAAFTISLFGVLLCNYICFSSPAPNVIFFVFVVICLWYIHISIFSQKSQKEIVIGMVLNAMFMIFVIFVNSAYSFRLGDFQISSSKKLHVLPTFKMVGMFLIWHTKEFCLFFFVHRKHKMVAIV